MKTLRGLAVIFLTSLATATAFAATPSIARTWDEEILSAIRIDLPHPPVHARNLFHLSVAMYDSWAAYDQTAVGYLYHGKATSADVEADRRTTISYAAYRILIERYSLSRGAAVTLPTLDNRMAAFGYDKNFTSIDPSTPAGLGNFIASKVSSYYLQDGAQQTRGYADLPANQGGYTSQNLALITTRFDTYPSDPNHWQPLAFTTAVTQNGIPADTIQKFLGAHWRDVRPFALHRETPGTAWIDPGSPPMLLTESDAQYKAEFVEVIRRSSELNPDDGVTKDISPGTFGNNSLGKNDGTGHPINPVTGLPYSPNVVNRGDYTRILAEFWADGPTSETPPGHWNTIANKVADHPLFVKRIGGTGPVVSDLEWDVKTYFSMNAALHDAACAAWTLKRIYDSIRPISAIRYMADKGQSTDESLISYNPQGLPLIPGLIEVVTAESSQTGARHQGLPLGFVVIYAWPGQPADPLTQHTGAKWILPQQWFPYQKKTFITPAFPGFISGHSTFSRAAAEVLTAITGSPFFPGGYGSFSFAADTTLTFEKGPSAPVELQWGTYYDAADQAGLSRIWGGIHPSVDDLNGRKVGHECGVGAWALARTYFNGAILREPTTLTISKLAAPGFELRWNTFRGLAYRLQRYPEIGAAPEDVNGTSSVATDSFFKLPNAGLDAKGFYRVVRETP